LTEFIADIFVHRKIHITAETYKDAAKIARDVGAEQGSGLPAILHTINIKRVMAADAPELTA
jgi:hypothetical protein